jgi:uncharacterized membrane protein YkvA (DUF1232 family)
MTGIPRLVFRLVMDRRVSLRLKLMLAAAAVYILLPIDMVPDIVPVLGRIDDILVLVLSIALFLGMAPREVVTEHLRSGRRDGTNSGPQSGPDQSVIEGEYHVVDEDEEPKKQP